MDKRRPVSDDARRGHPEFTPTDPPRREILGVEVPPLPKVPPAPVIVDAEEEAAPKPVKAEPEKPKDPAPEEPKKIKTQSLQHTWVGSLVAVVVALGGGQGISAITSNGVTKDQLFAVHERVARIERERSNIRKYLEDARRADVDRDALITGVLCRMNGGKEFARGVDCDGVRDWESIPNGQQVPVKARVVFPAHPTLPKPETD